MSMIKRFSLYLFLFFPAVCLSAIPALAIGYPHFLQNGYECASCHNVHGNQPKLIWEQAPQQDIDHTPFNQLCWSCHNDVDAPAVLTHSSLQSSNAYGNWTVDCVVCHDPHLHRQALDYPDHFIAQGVVGAVTATTLTKAGLADWTPDAFQGVILFPNTGQLYYSYRIVGNTADTLTVDPDVSSPMVDGSMDLSQVVVGGGFAIGYGKLIRSQIDLGRIAEYASTTLPLPAPDHPKSGLREVRFIGQTGTNSFADGNGVYDGICEVCHTKTNFHHNIAAGDHDHGPRGGNCIACHNHSNGFMHGGGSGAGCESCHGHDPDYEYEPDLFSEGAGTFQSHSTHTENDGDDLKGPDITCDVCHDTANYPYFRSGTDGNGDGLYSLAETDVCDGCHSPGGIFDGVDSADSSVGAKDNWAGGVYEGTALAAGKEKWCAGCHDDEQANSQSEYNILIVDNVDASFVGTWTINTTNPGSYDVDHAYDEKGSGAELVTWIPDIPAGGTYGVYAWWTSGSNHAGDAPYTVNYEGGSATVRVNQEVNGGRWNYLGTWNFAAGTSGSVVLSDDADEYVMADAILFVHNGNGPIAYAPNIVGDSTTYGFYTTGHGRTEAVNCLSCHDVNKKHIDHEPRTYEVDENALYSVATPYGVSYRLKDIDGKPSLTVPNGGGHPPTYWRDFRLCFSCHDRYEVITQFNFTDFDYSRGQTTNFWDGCNTRGNQHYYHLNQTGTNFDSDWDLQMEDSAMTCVTCHNVHGSPAKVMIRHGELISTPEFNKIPALDFTYLVAATEPPATATWTPDIPEGGAYRVYAWWTSHANRAPNTKYTVNFGGGSETITVNQREDGGQWNLLGTFDFIIGTSGSVVLSNDGAYGFVIADAVRLEAVSGAVDIIVDNPEATFVGTWDTDSASPTQYGDDIRYHEKPAFPADPDATLAESSGGQMRHRWMHISDTFVCRTCHNQETAAYYRPPNIGPRVLMRSAAPETVDNNGTDQVLLTAYVYSPKDNPVIVTIDLVPLGGSPAQVMYDDGSYGDRIPGDKLFSFLTTMPGTVGSGLKVLSVTGTDSDGLTDVNDVRLMVVNPGWLVVDNDDAAGVNCVGQWSLSNESEAYYHLLGIVKTAGTGNATVTWTPSLPQAGTYNVYASWYAATNRAGDTPFQIDYSSGSETVRVNQREYGSGFVYLGTYYFDAQTVNSYVIVDNEDAVFFGDWIFSDRNPTQYADSLRFHEAGIGDNTATFTPDLPQAGKYEVYAWWTPGANRGTNVPYTINYSGGSDIVLINQESGGGHWEYLGTYFFEEGTAGSVVLSDDADEYVIADAVKFQLDAEKQKVVLRDDAAGGYVIGDAILFEPQP